MINNTFIINPIRKDYIQRCLETLYEYTDMSNNKVIVVDQTLHGLFEDWEIWNEIKPKIHLYLRPHRNLGYSKSMNEGIIHAIRWGSKYVTCANDDIEFMDKRWWDGIVETFKSSDRIVAVNPMSPKEPLWGYGLDHGNYMELISHKQTFSNADYDYLLKGDFSVAKKAHNHLWEKAGKPNTYPDKKNGVIDGVATWCTIFKGDFFKEFGMFEERFYPGGGEDYDLDGRVYKEDKRMVGTTKSWVWHWWGSSKDYQGELQSKTLPIQDELRWNGLGELWPKGFDVWGKGHNDDGTKYPLYRIPEIGIIEI